MQKAIKILFLYVLPVVIALIIIALVALPHVAKKYVNEHGQEYAGRKLAVDQIRFNYFTNTLRIIDFKMFEQDDQQSFIAFDTLLIKINPVRLLSSELEIDQIRLVKPEVNIMRRDSVFNFDDIIAFIKSKPKGEPAKKSSGPYKYVLKNISLEKGKLSFNDKGANYTNIMKDLKFAVPYISYNEEEISKVGLKFYFENGGFFRPGHTITLKKGFMMPILR